MKKVVLWCVVSLIFISFASCNNKKRDTDNAELGYSGQEDSTEQYDYDSRGGSKPSNSRNDLQTDNQNDDSDFAEFGFPEVGKNTPNQLLYRMAYTTSYNRETRCPNWVAWHLLGENASGEVSRKGVPFYETDGTVIGIGKVDDYITDGTYFVDAQVPTPRQEHSDWRGNKLRMTHGHMCPAGDNKWDKKAMNQTFLLTNMCPQDHKSNAISWNSLENKCRSWTRKYGDIFIVAGPVFYNGISRTIGRNRIAVPDAFFKIVLRKDGNQLRTIGFIYPNDSKKYSVRQTSCSVNDIEEITGIDFFPNLSDDIEEQIEAMSDIDSWK